MMQKFEIHAVHTKLDDQLKAYVNRKIGGLDRYLSRHSRQSAHAEVFLKEARMNKSNRYISEVKLHLPHQEIIIKESALNMYAAIDIVEAKLKQQMQKYKQLHGNGKQHRHLFGRSRRPELATSSES